MYVTDLVLTTHRDVFRGNPHPSSLSVSFPFTGECYAIIGIYLLLTSVLCDGMFRLFQFEVRCKVAMFDFYRHLFVVWSFILATFRDRIV